MGKPEGFLHEKGWYRDDSSLLRSAQRGLFSLWKSPSPDGLGISKVPYDKILRGIRTQTQWKPAAEAIRLRRRVTYFSKGDK